MATGTSFIQFDVSPQSMLTSPPTLTITVNNFYNIFRILSLQILSMNSIALLSLGLMEV